MFDPPDARLSCEGLHGGSQNCQFSRYQRGSKNRTEYKTSTDSRRVSSLPRHSHEASRAAIVLSVKCLGSCTGSTDRKLLGNSTPRPHPVRSVPAVAPRDPPRSADLSFAPNRVAVWPLHTALASQQRSRSENRTGQPVEMATAPLPPRLIVRRFTWPGIGCCTGQLWANVAESGLSGKLLVLARAHQETTVCRLTASAAQASCCSWRSGL